MLMFMIWLRTVGGRMAGDLVVYSAGIATANEWDLEMQS